jgi:hypothetical protein
MATVGIRNIQLGVTSAANWEDAVFKSWFSYGLFSKFLWTSSLNQAKVWVMSHIKPRSRTSTSFPVW